MSSVDAMHKQTITTFTMDTVIIIIIKGKFARPTNVLINQFN